MKSLSLFIVLIFSIYQFAYLYQVTQDIMGFYKRRDQMELLHLSVIKEQLVHIYMQIFYQVCPR